MYKNVVVFSSYLPITDLNAKQLYNIDCDLKFLQGFARNLINDLLVEYNPFLEDEYDFIFYYSGNLKQFRSKYKYNVKEFIQNLSDFNKNISLTYIYGKLLQDNYEKIIIIEPKFPFIMKKDLRDFFQKLDKDKLIVNNDLSFFAINTKFDLFKKIYKTNLKTFLTEQNSQVKNIESKLFSIKTKKDLQDFYKSIIINNDDLKPEFLHLYKIYDFLKKNTQSFLQ